MSEYLAKYKPEWEELEALTGRKVTVNVIEIKDPNLSAKLVAEGVGEQLEKRAAVRRTLKQFCEAAINSGAKGVKIICSGRLGGAEIARRETQKTGSIPLHTLDANVDYATGTAVMTYGAIGIKVWIYKGRFGEEIEPLAQPRRRPPRRDRDGRPGPRPAPGPSERAAHAPTAAAAPAPAEPAPQAPAAEGSGSGAEGSPS